MIKEIAKLHIRSLPHTFSSRMGVWFVSKLYTLVSSIGFIHVVRRQRKIVGVISGIQKLILTLVVDPQWQRQGIGSELIGGISGKAYVYTEECSVGFYEKLRFAKLFAFGKIIFLCRR